MASIETEVRGDRTFHRVVFRDRDRRRRRIRLGGLNLKAVESIRAKVAALNALRIAGEPLTPDLARWVTGLGEDLAGKLAKAGLVEARRKAALGEFMAEYVAGREGEAAASTIANFRQLERSLCDHFGEDRDLRDVSEGEADVWRQELARKYAPATLNKLVKRARQVFKTAIRQGYCEDNPFADVRGGSEANDDRKQFVPRDAVAKAIDAAPDGQWRLVIALARYGGLRTPSETLELRWSDVDWDGDRFTVTSRKTKKQGKAWRVVPLFPELRPYLEEAFALADEGDEHVVTRYRDRNSNLRTQFLRILRTAGVEAWPRLFQNLRASRETELADRFPLHVVTAWLGNTPRVADKHYLQVRPEHFDQAVGEEALTPDADGGAASGAEVGQQSGTKPAATTRNDSQEATEASGLAAENGSNPEASASGLAPRIGPSS